MSTSDTVASSASDGPKYKRRLRNYLIDASLQVRYTGFIIAVAIILTAALGWKIFDAVRETSKIISMTGLVDPTTAGELQEQFSQADRVVIWGMAGFGVVLVLSIAGVGIWITHKVAGPLYNIARVLGRIRDNQLAPPLRALRKGDELQDFYTTFREMHEALRARASADAQLLGEVIAALEAAEGATPAAVLERIRQSKRDKETSLST
jgi:hypothetical protein